MCGVNKGLVGPVYKVCENAMFKTYGYVLYYSSAGTLWNMYDSILCYWTSSVNGELHLTIISCYFSSDVEAEYPPTQQSVGWAVVVSLLSFWDQSW